MAYTNPFIRLSFGGTLADDQEIWSCGIHLAQYGAIEPVSDWFAQVSANIGAIGDVLEGYIANPAVLVPSGVDLRWVKMALIGTDGLYMEEPVEAPLSQSGSQGGSYIPQASLVNTLVSAKWKDPGRYNRFYLPVSLNAFPEGTYALTEFAQTAYLAELKEFIEDINFAASVDGDLSETAVAVVSNTRDGSQELVTQVRLGRVVDTQRRRRNSLPEAYQLANVDVS